MRARFDDLRPGHALTLGFTQPAELIVAHDLLEVEPALRAVSERAADGAWAVGFVAYEAAPAFDPALPTHPAIDGVPLVWFSIHDAADDPSNWDAAADYHLEPWEAATSEEAYALDLAAIREEIRQGNTYQVNYTMRLRSLFHGDPHRWYLDLIEAQSGGYGAFLDTGRHQIVSASPELFFAWEADRIVTRPMKGTARRGRWPEEDRERRAALERSPKDQAENVMIVDLLRNDLGRIAEFGTVQVDRLFEAERFDTVWQLTSTVSAQTRPGLDLCDVFSALFPCGSVTGAPKSSTMAIIRDTETHPRGVYTGAIGFVEPGGGRAVFSVAIRTALVDAVTGAVEYGVGGGITFDSDVDDEYAEALAKSAVLERAGRSVDLLETMRWDRGVALLDGHLRRLGESADYFGVPVDIDEVRRAIEAFDAGEPTRLRLVVNRDGTFALESAPFVADHRAVRLAIDSVPAIVTDPLRYHKTTDRSVYTAARARHPDADDVVLVNDRGEAMETTIGNLLVWADGRWLTPPLESGCLPGVGRQALLDSGAVTEGTIPVELLERADAIEVVNALRGRRPARLIGH